MLFERDQVLIEEGDVHAVISICAIVLLIVAIVSTFGRIFTKFAVNHKLSVDDLAAFPALMTCGAQTAAILIASGSGLGRHWESLTASQQDVMQQSLYASGLLFIPTVVIAKVSVTLFITVLVPVPAHARIGLVFGLGVVAWGIASELAAAFQCRPPQTWNAKDNMCFDRLNFWKTFNIICILTDLFLVIWPSVVIYRLHTNLNRRLVTIVYFACRLGVIGATIALLIASAHAATSEDPSFDLWPSVICTQTVQALSVTTACTLYLRPFLESLESGMMRSDFLRRGWLDSSHRSENAKGTKSGSLHRPQHIGRMASTSISVPLRPLHDGDNTTTIRAEERHWEDGQSATSQTRIIRYTTTWAVATEPRAREGVAISC